MMRMPAGVEAHLAGRAFSSSGAARRPESPAARCSWPRRAKPQRLSGPTRKRKQQRPKVATDPDNQHRATELAKALANQAPAPPPNGQPHPLCILRGGHLGGQANIRQGGVTVTTKVTGLRSHAVTSVELTKS